jgi:hypothetical protein
MRTPEAGWVFPIEIPNQNMRRKRTPFLPYIPNWHIEREKGGGQGRALRDPHEKSHGDEAWRIIVWRAVSADWKSDFESRTSGRRSS